VVAPWFRAGAEPRGAEVADEVGQSHECLADQQLGDRCGPVGHVHVQVVGVVVGDHRRDGVLGEQVVERAHDERHVVDVGGLEHGPQLGLERPDRLHVTRDHRAVQPGAVGEVLAQRLLVVQVGVDERGRALGVPDEVHRPSLRRRPRGVIRRVGRL
jgi:hypothetical protein